MEKYSWIIVLALGLLTGCDYNEQNFPGLDDLSRPTNVVQYEYTILPGDFTAIVNALNAKKTAADSATAKILNADKLFSDLAPAENLIPYVLAGKFYSADKTSAANVSYQFKEGRSEELSKLAQPVYILNSEDYKLGWGSESVDAFTPSKAPGTEIPKILAANFPLAADGDFKTVEYYFSSLEPTVSQVEVKYLAADFEGIASGSGVATNLERWKNIDAEGNIFWQTRSYSGNQYTQVSSNNSKTKNDVWLISPTVDLRQAENPKFGFDITAGYYNASCLSVLVAEVKAESEPNWEHLDWRDISNRFSLPLGPASGYGVLSPAGEMDLKEYAGKKIAIAFRYTGNGIDNSASTTIQIDNVKIGEVKSALSVPEVEKQNAVFLFASGKWTPARNTITVLQPNDYAEMGLAYLTTANAPNYLPQYLSRKFPYAQENTPYSIIYKTGTGNTYYADEYFLEGGRWTLNGFVINKTDQFVVSDVGWVFDPTLYVTMKKGKEPTDDYMMMVQYVKQQPYYTANPNLVNSYGDSEYYFGFSANYGNISLRESDRIKDTSYPANGSAEEKKAFLNQRTEEGLAIYLSLKFPNAQPQVSGIDVYALVTANVYDGVNTATVVYKFQCIGSPSKWKYIE